MKDSYEIKAKFYSGTWIILPNKPEEEFVIAAKLIASFIAGIAIVVVLVLA